MKKYIILTISILLIASILLVGVCACKNNNVSEEDGETVIKAKSTVTFDDLKAKWSDLTFTTKTNDMGTVRYEAEAPSFFVTADTDIEGNIIFVELWNTVVDLDVIVSKTKLLNLMNTPSYNMSRKEICTSYCALNTSYLEELVGGKDESKTKAEFAEKYSAFFAGSDIKVGNWTITVTMHEKSEVASVTATFAE